MKNIRQLYTAMLVPIALGASLLFAESNASAGGLEPVALQCEYRVNPLGIDEARPRLTWSVESDDRGEKQTAYQILAASSEALLAKNQGDLWDSGKVMSDATVNIVYDGRPLTSRQSCFWKVRVWDK
ncbi:MAG: family 78 glycoside hydrolase catalytic domain, partial [Verrucomicrobiota bacterium]